MFLVVSLFFFVGEGGFLSRSGVVYLASPSSRFFKGVMSGMPCVGKVLAGTCVCTSLGLSVGIAMDTLTDMVHRLQGEEITVPVQAHCPCTSSLSLYKLTVPVQAHCPCTSSLSLYKLTVPVQAHCPCTSSLSLYKLTVPVQAHCPCTSSLSLYKLTVPVSSSVGGLYNQNIQMPLEFAL